MRSGENVLEKYFFDNKKPLTTLCSLLRSGKRTNRVNHASGNGKDYSGVTSSFVIYTASHYVTSLKRMK